MPRRRQLRGFAYNIARKFFDSSRHFVEMARRHDVRVVEIDLLAGTFQPSFFDIPRNRTLVGYCQNTLRRIMAKYPFELQRATLKLFHPAPESSREAPSCHCILVDDRGREWMGNCKRGGR